MLVIWGSSLMTKVTKLRILNSADYWKFFPCFLGKLSAQQLFKKLNIMQLIKGILLQWTIWEGDELIYEFISMVIIFPVNGSWCHLKTFNLICLRLLSFHRTLGQQKRWTLEFTETISSNTDKSMRKNEN